MAKSRLTPLVKPAISIAGAGLGAVLAGPLGAAIGGWLGDALGASTSKLLNDSAHKFGEKIIEKIADVSAASLVDKLKAPSLELEGLYREALCQSLRKVQAEPELQPFHDWFSNWERCLSGTKPLNLATIAAEQLAPDKLNSLFHDTMVSLDAQGRALRENPLSLRRAPRTMPEALDSGLNTRLPAILRRTFRSLITKVEYEAAWKEANQLFQDAVQLELESLGLATQRIDRRTEQIVEDTRAIRDRVEREADVPLLVLDLAEPTTVPWSIPPARDRSADIQQALTAEGRRLGAPDPHWLSEALAGRRERLTNARSDAADPIDETEEYAVKLKEWYGRAAYLLGLQHDAQTSTVRSILLVLRISNTGRMPAEKATIEIGLSRDLSVNEHVSEPAPLEPPPEVPSALIEIRII